MSLAFSSDRGSNHAHAVYVCWSEDLVNFSAPVLVLGDSSIPYRLLRRADGMFLAYSLSPPKYEYGVSEDGKRVVYDSHACTVCASLDLQHWTPLADDLDGQQLLCRTRDPGGPGTFPRPEFSHKMPLPYELEMQTSLDGITFSPPERIAYKGVQPYHMVGGQDRAGLYVVAFAIGGQSTVLRYDGGPAWKPEAPPRLSSRPSADKTRRGGVASPWTTTTCVFSACRTRATLTRESRFGYTSTRWPRTLWRERPCRARAAQGSQCSI